MLDCLGGVLYMLIFVVRPINRTSVAQGLFWWIRTQSRNPDTPGGSKMYSSKRGCLRRQTISLAPPPQRRVRARGTAPETRGWRSRHPSTGCHWNQNTPDQIHGPTHEDDRSVSQPISSQRVVQRLHSAGRYICLCLSLDRSWQKVKWPEGRIIVVIRGGEGRVRAEARSLLDYASHLSAMWA